MDMRKAASYLLILTAAVLAVFSTLWTGGPV